MISTLLRLAALIFFVLGLASVDLHVSAILLGLTLWVASTLVDDLPARRQP